MNCRFCIREENFASVSGSGKKARSRISNTAAKLLTCGGGEVHRGIGSGGWDLGGEGETVGLVPGKGAGLRTDLQSRLS
jgi:hypothetical protein